MDCVTIEYFGHSCFRLRYAGERIVLDPYEDGSVPGLPPLRTEAEYVYCSHDHSDHDGVACVTLLPHGEPSFTVTELLTDHDDAGGSLRGKNIIRTFTFGTLRVTHMGDIGRELTPEELAALKGTDALLIPVGGYYTIDAQQAKEMIDAIAPRVTVLMHYRTDESDYEVIAHIDDILKILGLAEQIGATLELTADTPKQTVMMKRK